MHRNRTQIIVFAAVLAATTLAEFPTALAQPAALPDTPNCAAAERLTPAQTAGPFYKANPPRRHVLNSGRPGERLMVTGFVLAKGCRPVPGARVDVWQADGAGNYDNSGFNLRGWELTDAQGRYWFETVVPGEYPGRTPHIHVKVTAPGRRTLTTQLYLPNATGNARDSIFNSALVMRVSEAGGLRVGRYDFVVDAP
jgi:protocatechuate 3,4-dioxygenase beta subunit